MFMNHLFRLRVSVAPSSKNGLRLLCYFWRYLFLIMRYKQRKPRQWNLHFRIRVSKTTFWLSYLQKNFCRPDTNQVDCWVSSILLLCVFVFFFCTDYLPALLLGTVPNKCFFFVSYLFQWNMESCPLLWNGTSEKESVNGNHWKRWGEMFCEKHKLL